MGKGVNKKSYNIIWLIFAMKFCQLVYKGLMHKSSTAAVFLEICTLPQKKSMKNDWKQENAWILTGSRSNGNGWEAKTAFLQLKLLEYLHLDGFQLIPLKGQTKIIRLLEQ